MKTIQLSLGYLRTVLLSISLISVSVTAFAQVKVGSNPTVISPNANFEAEAGNGDKTVILNNGNVGIGTTTPNVKLNIKNGSLSVSQGADNAFDAGVQGSVAAGTGNIVKSWYSAAVGQGNSVDGQNALVIGFQNATGPSGGNAFVYGQNNQVTGGNSLAGGTGCLASGNNSVALGQGTQATAPSAIALGFQNLASGNNSIALGQESVASGAASIALGYQAWAPESNSIALGRQAKANFAGSTVITDGHTSDVYANGANSMTMRYIGGYVLNSNIDLTTGVRLGAGQSSWSSISDVRAKTNISDVSYGLATVLKLAPRKYQYKNSNNKYSLGFIAQEVHKVIPEIVDVPSDPSKLMSIRYSEIIPVLTKAIQEQQSQIEMLRDKLSEVTAQMQKLASLKNNAQEEQALQRAK